MSNLQRSAVVSETLGPLRPLAKRAPNDAVTRTPLPPSAFGYIASGGRARTPIWSPSPGYWWTRAARAAPAELEQDIYAPLIAQKLLGIAICSAVRGANDLIPTGAASPSASTQAVIS